MSVSREIIAIIERCKNMSLMRALLRTLLRTHQGCIRAERERGERERGEREERESVTNVEQDSFPVNTYEYAKKRAAVSGPYCWQRRLKSNTALPTACPAAPCPCPYSCSCHFTCVKRQPRYHTQLAPLAQPLMQLQSKEFNVIVQHSQAATLQVA
jgi:hypothetical protein